MSLLVLSAIYKQLYDIGLLLSECCDGLPMQYFCFLIMCPQIMKLSSMGSEKLGKGKGILN